MTHRRHLRAVESVKAQRVVCTLLVDDNSPVGIQGLRGNISPCSSNVAGQREASVVVNPVEIERSSFGNNARYLPRVKSTHLLIVVCDDVGHRRARILHLYPSVRAKRIQRDRPILVQPICPMLPEDGGLNT